MLYEKKRLLTHKLIILVILAIGIALPLFFTLAVPSVAQVVDYEGYTTNVEETEAEIQIEFDTRVNPGQVVVEFFDARDNSLGTYTGNFVGLSKKVTATFYVSGGRIKSYEIIEINATPMKFSPVVLGIFIGIDVVLLLLLIYSFFSAYKVYEIDGNKIVVYSGWFQRYIKLNGIRKNAHNTLNAFKPFDLGCVLPDGTFVNATVTPVNKISLKINDQPYIERK